MTKETAYLGPHLVEDFVFNLPLLVGEDNEELSFIGRGSTLVPASCVILNLSRLASRTRFQDLD